MKMDMEKEIFGIFHMGVNIFDFKGDDLIRVCVEVGLKIRDAHNKGVDLPEGGVLAVICENKVKFLEFTGNFDSWVEDMDRILSAYPNLVGALYVNYGTHKLWNGTGERCFLKEPMDMYSDKRYLGVEGINMSGEYCLVSLPVVGDKVICHDMIFRRGNIGIDGDTGNVKSLFLEAFAYNMGYGRKVYN